MLHPKLPFDTDIFFNAFASQPIKKAFVFGSYARGDYDKGSDVDILVETEAGMDLFAFITLKYQLEELLKTPVDLVSSKGVSERLSPYIQKDMIQVYEK